MAKLIEGLAQAHEIMSKVCDPQQHRRWCKDHLRSPKLTFDLQEVYRAENGREIARFDITGVKR